MQRRRFLTQLAATLPALTVAGRLFAAPPSAPRFLLVFLRGGYDCANVLVPYASDFYYASRPNIAIAKPQPDAADGALALDAHWALAPALRATLAPLWAQKQLAFVPFAGTEDLSRSHFETQDSIERGQPTDKRNFSSGFMARLAGVLGARAAPIAFTDALPLTFRGGGDVPNASLKNVGKAPFDARQSELIASMYEGHPLHAAVSEGLDLRQQLAQEFAADGQAASRGAVNAKGFAAEAARIGKLLRDEYRLGFVDVGGWDTHVNQGGAQGQLANNLDGLGQGLQALVEALGDAWSETVVAVVSEFGRTFRENGNRGTDHGHGSVYWVLGGGVHGGRIAGEQVAVAPENLLQNRDFPVLNDYRAVLGGLFQRLWGLDKAQLEKVFPRAAVRDLRLV